MGDMTNYYKELAWQDLDFSQVDQPQVIATRRFNVNTGPYIRCDPDDKPVKEFPPRFYYHKDSQNIYYSHMGNKRDEVQYTSLRYPEILCFLPKNFWKACGQQVSHFDTMTTSHLTNCYNWLGQMSAGTDGADRTRIIRKMEEIATYLKTRQAAAPDSKTKGKEMDNESTDCGSVAMGINSVQVCYVPDSLNSRLYWFLTDMQNLEVGDFAAVYSNGVPAVVRIATIVTDHRRGHEWLIQKIDMASYQTRKELRLEREKLKKALDEKLKAQEEMLRWKSLSDDPEAAAMLARFEELKT